MQQEPDNQNPNVKPLRPITWLLFPVIAVGLALGAALAVKIGVLRQANLVAKRSPPSAEMAAGRQDGGEPSGETMLTDSILSIIQNYYVDPGRVENRALLETTLAALSTDARIHTGSAPGAVWVQIEDDDKQIFPIKEKPSYQDVLDVFSAVARLLDESDINLAVGDMPEKHAPGSIALLNALLTELDAHSALLSPDAYRELRQGTEGSFGGLGVLVGIRENLLTVIKPLPHSPAQRAGIKKHDRILGIGGVFTYGYTLDDLVEYMRGDPGSEVQLTVLRDGAHAPKDLTLKREVIHVDSVTSEEINRKGEKVLHLTIESFASRTSREVLAAIKRFKVKTGGVLNGLILDLRSNPGGLLDQAVQVADLFLDSGVIVTTRGRHEEVETAGSGFDEMGFPMVVLVDGDSASASEIVAGALQDHQRALVVGQPSFGKGSVQTVFELPNDRALKLTIARYYTPAGRSIQNVGIIPDVWLQPVAKLPQNENMFGLYRYKNERFLKNHLETTEASAAIKSAKAQPVRRSYYLTSNIPGDDADNAVRQPDREMEFALKIINKVHAAYGDTLPPGTERASHWLGLAGPTITEAAQGLEREAVAWLKSKHKVDWSPVPNQPPAPNLALHLSSSNPRTVTSGENINIGWSVENNESIPISHLSVFVRSENSGFETKEILIGTLAAGSTRTGAVQVTIPANLPAGPLPLRIGVAADAWPVRQAVADYPLDVESRPVAHLTAKADLVDEMGGRVGGALESREKARLRVTVTNDGDVEADDLSLKLINLAGSQVQITGDTVHMDELGVHEEKQIFFALRAGRVIESSEVAFGLYGESGDLKQAFRQRFSVKSLPSAELSAKPSKLLSH